MRLLKALVGKKRFLLGLEARDLPDKQAGERLGNHVSDRVTNLDGSVGSSTGETHQREQVDERVSTPRDNCNPAGGFDQALGIPLRVHRRAESKEKSVHNEDKGNHSQSPKDPAGSVAGGNFTRVAEDNHEGGRQAELEALFN